MVARSPSFTAEADRLENSSSRKDLHEDGPAGGSPGASRALSFCRRVMLVTEVSVLGVLQLVAVLGIIRFLLG